jgi:hypothetical protein
MYDGRINASFVNFQAEKEVEKLTCCKIGDLTTRYGPVGPGCRLSSCCEGSLTFLAFTPKQIRHDQVMQQLVALTKMGLQFLRPAKKPDAA